MILPLVLISIVMFSTEALNAQDTSKIQIDSKNSQLVYEAKAGRFNTRKYKASFENNILTLENGCKTSIYCKLYNGILSTSGNPFSPEFRERDIKINLIVPPQISQLGLLHKKPIGSKFSVTLEERQKPDGCMRWKIDGEIVNYDHSSSRITGWGVWISKTFKPIIVKLFGKHVSNCGSKNSKWRYTSRDFTATYFLQKSDGLLLYSVIKHEGYVCCPERSVRQVRETYSLILSNFSIPGYRANNFFTLEQELDKRAELIRKQKLAKKQKRLEKDSFQQIMNYVFTGNPFSDEIKGSFIAGSKNMQISYRANVRIFDKEDCIAGWEAHGGVWFKIYWNNVDLSSITHQDKVVHNKWIKHLFISGTPHIANIKASNKFSFNSFGLAMLTKDIKRVGFHSSLAVPLDKAEKYNDERLKKALRLLYSKHCTGLKRKSAF